MLEETNKLVLITDDLRENLFSHLFFIVKNLTIL